MRRNKRLSGEKAYSILTVDDSPIMTSALSDYFQRSGYEVDTENDPVAAIEKVRNGNYDILLLDFMMTPICGDKVIEEIRKFNKDIYIILLTGHKSMAPPLKTLRELDIQGYYEKSERFDQLELLVESCVKSLKQLKTIREYQEELNKAYETMNDNYMEMIHAMRLLVDARDVYTRGHSDRVAALAVKIARRMGMSEEDVRQIRLAGLFHDIGKVGVPDGVLLKAGKLTDEEFDVIKQHPEKGEKILEALSFFKSVAPVVRSHHERIDGKGYPDGLKGEEIPLESRVITISDAFDAMTSDRHYRKSKSVKEAVSEIEKNRGTQFDQKIADIFLKIVQETGTEDLDKYLK